MTATPESSGPLEGFEVTVRYPGTAEVVVAPCGEIDLITVPHLGDVVAAVIGRGPATVVLDMGGVTFMDAGGLGIIATGANHLSLGGGRLVLRDASPLVRRTVEMTGLDQMVEIEEPVAALGDLGAGESSTGAGAARTSPLPEATPQRLRRVAAMPAADDVIDAALRLVVALARLTVERVDGVSVTLTRHGRLTTVAASDATVSSMDAHQYATGEGPCIDASVNGRFFHAESLEEEDRWPAFTPRALGLGINAILSTPLMSLDRPIGALNMYSRTAKAFAGRGEELAAAFATEASSVLSHAGVGVSKDALIERLSESLRLREAVAQAQGILMERERLGADEAYATLRRFSVSEGRTFAALAAEVVASTGRRDGQDAMRRRDA